MSTIREFPPLYEQTGDAASDRLAFFHILERLKTQKRTGWVDNNIKGPESISDHMYRMAVLSMCTSDEKLDISKCVMMSIVHDLAEAQVGDITPREGFSKSEKNRLESEAMHNFVHDMLHYSSAAKRIEALWLEYEEGRTAEAKFVKDLDRFEMACQGMRTYPCITDIWLKYQALEYERRNEEKDLQSFFDSSLPFIRHPEVQGWGKDLLNERNGGSSSGSKADSSQDTT